jgi:hypothetical protein
MTSAHCGDSAGVPHRWRTALRCWPQASRFKEAAQLMSPLEQLPGERARAAEGCADTTRALAKRARIGRPPVSRRAECCGLLARRRAPRATTIGRVSVSPRRTQNRQRPQT